MGEESEIKLGIDPKLGKEQKSEIQQSADAFLQKCEDQFSQMQLETPEECFVLDARYGETEDVRQTLAESPALANCADERGNTGLMMASSNGHTDIVKLVLGTAGVCVNRQNKAGNTALHWAALLGIKEVVGLLLEAGADVNLVNECGKKAFDEAFTRSNGSGAEAWSEICELLAPTMIFPEEPEPTEEPAEESMKESTKEQVDDAEDDGPLPDIM